MRGISARFGLLALWCLAIVGAVGHGGTPKQAPAATQGGCATCHRTEWISQRQTLMGKALALPGDNPVLQKHPRLTVTRGAFTYTVSTQGAQSVYSVTDGTETLSTPIQWAFGAGAQTWMFTREGKTYESLVSFFPSLNGLGITIGDDIFKPRSVSEAMGRELQPQEIKSCFQCHTTGSIVDGALDLHALKAGVTCEHCHAGAAVHLIDAAQNKFTSTPPSLGELSSEDLSNFCGQCHRTWSTVVLRRTFGEDDVRFAPYRLALSRCFNGTDARIGCIACHNPHADPDHAPASYDAKCLACHAGPKPKNSEVILKEHAAATKTCPVASSKCVSCHMPKVARAEGHLSFTDHYIRVVHPGDKYPD